MSTEKITERQLFSERLKTLRGKANKAAFSKLLGFSPPVYQRYEEGRIPSAENLSVIAERCGVSVDWLLGREEKLHNLTNLTRETREAALPAGTEIDLAGSGEKHVVRDARGTYGAPPGYHLTTWRPSWSTMLGKMSDGEIMAEIRHGVDRIEDKPRGPDRAHQCHGLMDYLNELANRKEKEG